MNKWLFYQNGFTRTTLSSTVGKFVEVNKFLFAHRQDSWALSQGMTACSTRQSICQTQCIQHVQSISKNSQFIPCVGLMYSLKFQH